MRWTGRRRVGRAARWKKLGRFRPCLLSGNVALFSHGEFGCSLAARWIGLSVMQAAHFQLATASLSILGFNPDHPGLRVIAQWNVTR